MSEHTNLLSCYLTNNVSVHNELQKKEEDFEITSLNM
jgi:hypothetical protein